MTTGCRRWTAVLAGLAFVALLAGSVLAAAEVLVAPVLIKARAAAPDSVQIGLKAARAGVVIKSATVRPQDAKEYVMPLNDSGQAGDTAGDGIWTVSIPLPVEIPPGSYNVEFEAQVTVNGQPQTATAIGRIGVLPSPAYMVEIVTPKPEVVLSGPIDVQAKVGSAIGAARAVAYLGAASAEMKQAGDVWTATLNTTRASNGRHRLVVAASPAGTSADPQRVAMGRIGTNGARQYAAEAAVTVHNPYNYYWGDIHSHTGYSDGVATPEVAYRHVRDVAKLDFYCVTDHVSSLTFDEYDDIRRQADAFYQPGVFAALYGFEWTQRVGHECIYFPDRYRLSDDLETAYRELAELGLSAHFNHPGLDNFDGERYSPSGAMALHAAEVRRPNEEAAYVAMLNAGWLVGADGSQDVHGDFWGRARHFTVAMSRELTREGIMDAIRARRTYSSWDRNLRLEFTLDGEDMGAAVARPAGKLPVVVEVSDADAGDNIALIEAVFDGKTVASVAPKATSYRWLARFDFKPGRHYLYMRVTEADGNMAYSSPIWVQVYKPMPEQAR